MRYVSLLSILLLLTSCYRQELQMPDAEEFRDYSFVVSADSLLLVVQQPTEVLNDMLVDTIAVYRSDLLVVADVMTMGTDTVDSVWMQVARDVETAGWIHESELLPAVTPDQPISLFIDYFSDSHLLFMLAFVVLVLALYLIRLLYRQNAKLVHFNDIASFYPALLALLVAASAVFYSTIQIVNPESWRHYYYHPTLNPFIVPLHLGLFLASVWLLLIVAIATFDDILRRLPAADALFYSLGLIGVCAVNYIVFSITTLYFVGYPLLLAYIVFAVWCYVRVARPAYRCGHCGGELPAKGVCPHCGALNE